MADVILLLISVDFLASEYCYSKEMETALTRHDAGTASVIPVILRPCDWKSSPFRKVTCASNRWSTGDDVVQYR